MKSKLVCEDCGREFLGVKARRCAECFRKRLSMYAKARNLNKMGNEAYSRICAEKRKAAKK